MRRKLSEQIKVGDWVRVNQKSGGPNKNGARVVAIGRDYYEVHPIGHRGTVSVPKEQCRSWKSRNASPSNR